MLLLLAAALAGTPLIGQAWVENGSLVVRNESDFAWTQVVAVVDGATMCSVGDIPVGEARAVSLAGCEGTPAATPTRVELQLKQGSLSMPLQVPTGDRKLRFTATLTRFPISRITITNTDTLPLTGCTITINGTWRYAIPTIDTGGNQGVFLNTFRDAKGMHLNDRTEVRGVRLTCDDGSGTFIIE